MKRTRTMDRVEQRGGPRVALSWALNGTGAVPPTGTASANGVAAAQDARTRVEGMTRDGDFARVADLLIQHRDSILDRWLEAASAQPFHAGRRESAVANHIPNLIDALLVMLRRTEARASDAGTAMHEPAVLEAARDHARTRTAHGLAAADIVTEFRLLRQEIGWALRLHLADATSTSDVLAASLLLHDALDDAAFLSVLALDQQKDELRRLQEVLANEQTRLAALLELLPAAVIMADAPSGQIALGHPTVKRLTPGKDVPIPAGEHPNEWQGFHRDGRRYTPQEWPLARAVHAGEVVTGEEIDYLREDGRRGTVSVNAAPVRDPQGAVVAGVAIFTDVTERRSLEQEKEAFLTAITHDIRSPLTVVKGTALLLQREIHRGPIPKQRLLDRLRRIDDAANRMDRQLIELQDIARIRTGQAIDLQRKSVDLVSLVQDGAARHQLTSEDHEIVVTLSGLEEPELLGQWDEPRLDRVLDNLVGNAVKYSPRGGKITLTVALDPISATGDNAEGPPTAIVRVRDEGIGIPAEDLPHVFDWFRRASNAAGEIAGTGIGLAAARQIAELHGGTVDVESEEDRGSTFTLRLPLAPPAKSVGPEPALPPRQR